MIGARIHDRLSTELNFKLDPFDRIDHVLEGVLFGKFLLGGISKFHGGLYWSLWGDVK